jgi:hypothetical protein
MGGADRHFWLTRSMARMIGVNLSRAMAAGRLTPQGYAEMVSHCRCASSCDRCVEWLAAQSGRAEAVPDFCVNAGRLNALRH